MRRFAALTLLLAAAGCPNTDEPPDPGFTGVKLDPHNVTGVQFETPTFAVPQGTEEQDCYFIAMPDLNGGQDYFVDRVRVGANPGSHHTNVFRVNTIYMLDGNPGDVVKNGQCFKSSNWATWPLVVNNQQSDAADPYFDWQLPDGVAYRFSPGEKLMVQTHYVNATTQTTPYQGKVVLDLYRSTLAAPTELGTQFATQQSIRVCQSNPNPTYHGTCAFQNGGVTIAAANGHFHSRGVEFDIFRWDGTSITQPPESDRFYQSREWAEPPMSIYPPGTPNMQVAPGAGVWWTCEYQWTPPPDDVGGCAALNAADPEQANDCCYTFGPKVEINEHCNTFVYYYPRVSPTDVTCF